MGKATSRFSINRMYYYLSKPENNSTGNFIEIISYSSTRIKPDVKMKKN